MNCQCDNSVLSNVRCLVYGSKHTKRGHSSMSRYTLTRVKFQKRDKGHQLTNCHRVLRRVLRNWPVSDHPYLVETADYNLGSIYRKAILLLLQAVLFFISWKLERRGTCSFQPWVTLEFHPMLPQWFVPWGLCIGRYSRCVLLHITSWNTLSAQSPRPLELCCSTLRCQAAGQLWQCVCVVGGGHSFGISEIYHELVSIW